MMMQDIERKVIEWLDQHSAKAIRLLKRLVGEKSTLGKEFNAQAVVLEKLRQFHMDIDVWEPSLKQLKQHPYFISDRSDFHESPNIVAKKTGEGGGRSLILNGHIDVVPEGNLKEWKYEPFQAAEVNGKIYGRGSTDMKGGNTALLFALEALHACDVKLKGDVLFQSVIDEECGGAGTLSAIMRGYRADGALIPEPTNMKLFIKQQGSMWFRITVKGLAAHGGTRYEGVSAIEKSMHVITAIQELEKVRNARISDPLYDHIPIPVPINIGTISGGTWPSSVADRVVIEGRCGIAPHEKPEAVKMELENWLKDLQYHDEWFKRHPIQVEWFGAQWLPNDLPDGHPLLSVLQSAYQKMKQTEPIIEASPWGTDGGLLYHAGDTPVIVFGPGETKTAHQANEYIEVEAMLESAKIIALFVMDWCGLHTDGEDADDQNGKE
ncbi:MULTISPECIES: peptidase [Bacillus]|uniref:peptidase n=1 Tax=Bacillus TaxID=1386 RepID=UPI00227DEF79|nr:MULTISPECIES: peptidase [Bacillus]MCY8981129.1 peptidase [Bacillus halotolerans]MDY7431051.1 peptidase [Bacillus sp. V26]MEC1665259.1 peptidase [Bacillus halotolerans]